MDNNRFINKEWYWPLLGVGLKSYANAINPFNATDAGIYLYINGGGDARYPTSYGICVAFINTSIQYYSMMLYIDASNNGAWVTVKWESDWNTWKQIQNV